MTAIYRIYTEDRANLLQIVARHFSGANLQHTSGLWQGEVEAGAIVEIIGAIADAPRAVALAEDIVRENEQAEVLCVRQSPREIAPLVIYGPRSPLYGRGESLRATQLAEFCGAEVAG